jgi:general secretion pathway protein H
MRNKGFTLVEILVVVVIMAVVISLAVMSIGVTGRDAQLDEESRRIEGLLGLLHERALLEGRDFGMRIEPAAYAFEYYDVIRQSWLPLDQEREFRRRTLPQGLSFQLELDSVQVVLKAPDPNLSSDQAPPAPQVAVAASGEGTPFRLTLLREASAAKAAVCGDAWGRTTATTDQYGALVQNAAASQATATGQPAGSGQASAASLAAAQHPCDDQPGKRS